MGQLAGIFRARTIPGNELPIAPWVLKQHWNFADMRERSNAAAQEDRVGDSQIFVGLDIPFLQDCDNRTYAWVHGLAQDSDSSQQN